MESAADAAARLQHAGDDPEVTAEIATEDAVAPAVDDARDADSALEIDPEPAVAVEPAPEIDPEHAAELEPEPALEPSVELEPEPAVEPESAVEPEIEVEPVPEAGPALPDDPEPESAVEREPVIEPDVVVERDLADALDAAIAPETADDVDGDAEPDADDADDDLDLLIADPLADLDVEVDTAVPALSLRGVSKSFGSTRAVDDIDLTVPAGTFYGIVGPNGAGKTTTLSMIAGLLRADSGSISVTGIDLARDPAGAKRRMGILPDRLRTFDRLTGRQLLHYYGVLRGLRSGVVESRIADLARAFDLTDALGRAVSDYSTGMTKKLMLAGAMIHSPRVLVLDEPFESVDPVSSAVILDILSAYVAHGGTVILSSHGM
ncbi:MAG TPA: ATP-binding cassette domain-containing protein, partial [Microbacterium sp.]|nr:ATP-binding cassette domain-containing protein [Microbacterium sp.]